MLLPCWGGYQCRFVDCHKIVAHYLSYYSFFFGQIMPLLTKRYTLASPRPQAHYSQLFNVTCWKVGVPRDAILSEQCALGIIATYIKKGRLAIKVSLGRTSLVWFCIPARPSHFFACNIESWEWAWGHWTTHTYQKNYSSLGSGQQSYQLYDSRQWMHKIIRFYTYLMQCHVRDPNVSVRVNSESVWHVELGLSPGTLRNTNAGELE